MLVRDIGHVVDVQRVLNGLLGIRKIQRVEVGSVAIVFEYCGIAAFRGVALDGLGGADLDGVLGSNDDGHEQSLS